MKKITFILVGCIIAILILLTVAYNFGTSQYCIKNIILPIVEKKTNSKFSVKNIEVSALNSSLRIRGLIYDSPDLSVNADRIDIQTSIYELLFDHKITIKRFLLENSDIDLKIRSKEKADSSKAPGETSERLSEQKIEITKKKSKSSLYKISLNDINFKNINLKVTNNNTVSKINNFSLNIPNIEPGKECTINLDCKLSMSDGKTLLDGFVRSKTLLTLREDFMPVSINSSSLIDIGNNKIPFSIHLNTEKDGAYNFNALISNVVLEPFATAFIPGIYSSTKGKIDKISLDGSGDNIDDLSSGRGRADAIFSAFGIDVFNENVFSVKNKSTSNASI